MPNLEAGSNVELPFSVGCGICGLAGLILKVDAPVQVDVVEVLSWHVSLGCLRSDERCISGLST